MIDEVKKILIEQLQEKIKDIDEQKKKIDAKGKSFEEFSKEQESVETPEYKQTVETIKKYEKATVLSDLNLNVKEAIQILESHKRQVILTEADKQYKNSSKANYTSKEDFICVHKTDYVPTDSKIKTNREANALIENKFEFDGKKYKINYKDERDTVHTCVNGEVGDHGMGNWSTSKYAILTPLKSIKNEQIGGALAVDLFTIGGIDLDEDSWILCPKGEKQSIQKNNPKVHVIEYEGESVTGYAQAFVSTLGYHAEIAGSYGWIDAKENEESFKNILTNEKGIQNIGVPHSQTSFSIEEDRAQKINKVVATLDKINKENLIKSFKDIIKINQSIDKATAMSVFANLDEFFLKMEEVGLTISDVYKDILTSKDEIMNIAKNGSEEELDKIFVAKGDITAEENLVIDNLKNTIKDLSKHGQSDKIKDTFYEFLNIAVTSNMESVKKLEQNSYEDSKKSFMKVLNESSFIKDEQQPIAYTRTYRSTINKSELYIEDDLVGGYNKFRIICEDFMRITYNSPKNPTSQDTNKGNLTLRYEDKDGSVYTIDFDEGETTPKTFKNFNPVKLEKGESILDIIPDSRNKRIFESYYNRIISNRINNIENMLKENLSAEERPEEQPQVISTTQIGKKSIKAETLDKKQIETNFEQLELKFREEGIYKDD